MNSLATVLCYSSSCYCSGAHWKFLFLSVFWWLSSVYLPSPLTPHSENINVADVGVPWFLSSKEWIQSRYLSSGLFSKAAVTGTKPSESALQIGAGYPNYINKWRGLSMAGGGGLFLDLKSVHEYLWLHIKVSRPWRPQVKNVSGKPCPCLCL